MWLDLESAGVSPIVCRVWGDYAPPQKKKNPKQPRTVMTVPVGEDSASDHQFRNSYIVGNFTKSQQVPCSHGGGGLKKCMSVLRKPRLKFSW